MAPSLSISYGPDSNSLSPLDPNDDNKLHSISTPKFKGRVSVRVLNFTGKGSSSDGEESKPPNSTSPYFEGDKGRGMTYSIQIQGKWLDEDGIDLDDLVFGNTFDHPIRDKLPYGTSIALKAASFIDPNLSHDLYSDKPWALSPLLATMNKVHVIRSNTPSSSSSTSQDQHSTDSNPSSSSSSSDFSTWPTFPSPEINKSDPEKHYVKEDISSLFYTPSSNFKEIDHTLSDFIDMGEIHSLKSGNSHTRTQVLSREGLRKRLRLTKDEIVDLDFCNGFIDFNTLKVQLPHTGGWGIDLKGYWDGQPVRYVCKNRRNDQVYFVVQFDIVDLDT